MEEENVVTAEEIAKDSNDFGSIGNTHYSQSMDAAAMQVWAKKIVEEFDKAQDIFYVLCYRGMSGISAATHLSIQMGVNSLRHGMMYVRKPEEQSHGKIIESFNVRDYAPERHRLVFVFCDDFVCSGDTMIATMNTIQKYFSIKVDTDVGLMALNGSEGALLKMSDEGRALDEIIEAYDETVLPAIKQKILDRREAAKELAAYREREAREWGVPSFDEVCLEFSPEAPALQELADEYIECVTADIPSYSLSPFLSSNSKPAAKKLKKTALSTLRDALGLPS